MFDENLTQNHFSRLGVSPAAALSARNWSNSELVAPGSASAAPGPIHSASFSASSSGKAAMLGAGPRLTGCCSDPAESIRGASIRDLPGVTDTRVGYTGGDVPNATYRNHGTHAPASATRRVVY